MIEFIELRPASQDQVGYIGSWLQAAKHVNDAIPIMQRAYDYALAQDQAFSGAPSGTDASPFRPVSSIIDESNSFWKANVPIPCPSDASACSSGLAFAVSAGTVTINTLSQFTADPDPATREWATVSLTRFVQLNTQMSNVSFVQSWLAKIWPAVADEFQSALTIYSHARAGTADYNSAAFAMRNVLESLNGNLLELARRQPGAKCVRKWEDAAKYTAKDAPSSPETHRLVEEGSTYRTLKQQLTNVGKGDAVITTAQFESMYAVFIGLLFTACTLIDKSTI